MKMKVYRMTATVNEKFEYTMCVPDHWDAEDVRKYYVENPLEYYKFEVDGRAEWTLGVAIEIDDRTPEEISKLEYIGVAQEEPIQ